ncbi:NAD(P)-dependent dehydrogenase, short-chain alcohol dehydrogenase family [Rhodococcus rhodochrous J3]|uniref:SDR family oxidoreductase n=2 Tax=Rhodococcus rhodochrous TaxID=1829 RepID=A0AA47AB29_RHORH|nr:MULTISPECIES: SDR family oxidoreductase [Rhodococcus]MBF4479907.1 SDR family oxidoreductase [Rhodococcus rhodochrous]MDC3728587.1 SDR family oxidoreductase [Rhodococcus sp. Rp3]MDJ0398423.1 SDR family oxidoreductase [Rhodococcus rhodochrous]MDO1486254.1 SDR family oxidoreductase [Rhodococcus rhodochrous]TWH62935.1 NAD(P)-dependent dehydrogenase (short-subunit alcohol dehydrogenase family) [Rhodococcus rhodochrous J38]
MTTVGIATGAGRGMGYACAQRMIGTVDTVLLVDLDADTVRATADELNGDRTRVEPIVLDVTDVDGLERLAARVTELGTLRSVAHAAGISPTMADWRRIFAVDLVGTARLARALRPLATAGTASVYFASMAPNIGRMQPSPEEIAVLADPLAEDFLDRLREVVGEAIEHPGVAYAWAKYGVQQFARDEAVRLGAVGARACSVSPGIIDTPQGRQEADHNESMGEMVRATPLGRTGRAEELAAVVTFLLSDEASFVNGTDVLVDGGVVASLTSGADRASVRP